MGLHQTKKFLHSKENQQNKRQPTEWENIFANTSDKGLIFKIYKVLTFCRSVPGETLLIVVLQFINCQLLKKYLILDTSGQKRNWKNQHNRTRLKNRAVV